MFRDYYLSLTKQEREFFCKETGIAHNTIRNSYIKEHPLERTIPSAEKIAKMILVSQQIPDKPVLNLYGLRGHFFDELVFGLLQEYQEKHNFPDDE